MKLHFAKIVLSIVAISAVACSSDIDSIVEELPVAGDEVQPGEVRIAVPEGTRSSIVDEEVDGVTYGVLRWDSRDEISILAYDSNDNSIVMSPTQFKFVGSKENGNGSYFTAIPDLSNMTDDGTYNYYAISPSLDAINPSLNRPTLDGSKLSFTIPQKQYGQFRADMDLMIAKASGKPALEACEVILRDEEGEIKDATRPINNLDLMFYHRTHILHFTIPQDVTNNLGAAIKRVHLVFPDAVVGTLSVDIKNNVTYDPNNGITSPVPTYSNTNNKITVEFESPKRADDDFWVMTLPHVGAMENIDIRFEDVNGNVSQRRQVTFANMSANRVTPINVQTIPEAAGVTSFYCTVGTNNLGEDLTSMNITLPAGCYFTNFEQSYKAKLNDGKHTFSVFNDMLSAVENQTLPFELESDHALFSQTIDIPNLVDNSADNNLGSKDVPYLLFEDFSGIPNFNDGHDNPTVGWYSDNEYKEIKALSQYTNSLNGWYGTRIGGSSGNSVRICCRYENITIGWGSSAFYKGRLYTPFLSNIKSKVKVKVTFKYGGEVQEGGKTENQGSFWRPNYVTVYPNKNPLLYFGVNSQEVVENPDKIEGNLIDQVTGLVGGSGFASSEPKSLSPMVINGDKIDRTGGSYTSFNGTKSVTVEVDSDSRLGWIVTCDNDWTNTNANYWLYLDDIKVQIAK